MKACSSISTDGLGAFGSMRLARCTRAISSSDKRRARATCAAARAAPPASRRARCLPMSQPEPLTQTPRPPRRQRSRVRVFTDVLPPPCSTSLRIAAEQAWSNRRAAPGRRRRRLCPSDRPPPWRRDRPRRISSVPCSAASSCRRAGVCPTSRAWVLAGIFAAVAGNHRCRRRRGGRRSAVRLRRRNGAGSRMVERRRGGSCPLAGASGCLGGLRVEQARSSIGALAAIMRPVRCSSSWRQHGLPRPAMLGISALGRGISPGTATWPASDGVRHCGLPVAAAAATAASAAAPALVGLAFASRSAVGRGRGWPSPGFLGRTRRRDLRGQSRARARLVRRMAVRLRAARTPPRPRPPRRRPPAAFSATFAVRLRAAARLQPPRRRDFRFLRPGFASASASSSTSSTGEIAAAAEQQDPCRLSGVRPARRGRST